MGDIFQIDPADGRLEQQDRFNKFVGIFGIQTDGEAIDAAQIFVEQHLSFHHRDGRFGADVAQTQHPGAVADDGHRIPFIGMVVHSFGVSLDIAAGGRHAGGIPDGKIVDIPDAAFQRGFDFASIKRMQLQCIGRRFFGFGQ